MDKYVVVVNNEKRVEGLFGAEDRCKLKDGVWLVVSTKHSTSKEVFEALGETENTIVFPVKSVVGRAPSEIVEKVNRWWSDE